MAFCFPSSEFDHHSVWTQFKSEQFKVEMTNFGSIAFKFELQQGLKYRVLQDFGWLNGVPMKNGSDFEHISKSKLYHQKTLYYQFLTHMSLSLSLFSLLSLYIYFLRMRSKNLVLFNYIYQKLCYRKGRTVQLHIKDYKKFGVGITQLFCCSCTCRPTIQNPIHLNTAAV